MQMKPTISVLFLLIHTLYGFAQESLSIQPLKVHYQTKKLDSTCYEIQFDISINEPYRIISPFSKDSAWVKTEIFFDDSSTSKFINNLIEMPQSKEEFDPISNQNVHFIREKASFMTTIKVPRDIALSIKGHLVYMAITDHYALPKQQIDFKLALENMKLTIIEE